MEARLLIGCIGLLCAFAFAACGAALLYSAWMRRLSLLGESASLRSILQWRLRNGFAFALPFARVLLRSRRVCAVFDELLAGTEDRGFSSTEESLTSVFAAATAGLTLLLLLVSGNMVCLAIVPALCIVACASFAGSLRDRRADSFQQQIPKALESMSACFGNGYTLLQTFRQVASEVPRPVGGLFASAAGVLESGGGASEALEVLRSQQSSNEIAFMAVALDIQHQTGGSLRSVIDAAAQSVKSELELKRSLRVQTAQARLSARVVSLMPLVLVTLFSLASPTFMQPFFQSVFGFALLVLAIAMQITGVLLVRRALSVGELR